MRCGTARRSPPLKWSILKVEPCSANSSTIQAIIGGHTDWKRGAEVVRMEEHGDRSCKFEKWRLLVPFWLKPMMSLSLPPEILDLILDHLHDESTTLKTCSTLSKSWVSRARAHIFADVEFCPISSPIESWTRVFPDPSNSPAHYTRSLSVGTYSLYTRSVEAHPWISSFRRVTKLAVNTIRHGDDTQISFSQLRGFSPVLKRFLLIYSSVPPSEIFDLVCSFPSLEDLALISLAENEPEGGWTIPSTSPKLTGELVLRMGSGIRFDVLRLLDLPGGLHFSTISITSPIRDAESIADLVSRCSNTLESLGISYYSPGAFL